MKAVRFRMDRMMIWVAIIAANLAVLRALYSTRNIPVLIGGTIVWLTLQWATFRAIRTSGRSRAFWLGFLGGGVVGSLMLAGGMAFPVSLLGRALVPYWEISFEIIERSEPWFDRTIGPVASELVAVLLLGLAAILPVVVAAGAGGAASRLLSGRRNPRSGAGIAHPCPSPR